MNKRSFSRLSLALFLFVASNAFGEKFRGYIWDIGDRALVVEGIPVELTEGAKIERSNHKGITFQDLRIGWETEVEGKRGREAFLADKLKIKNKRFQEVDLKGFLQLRDDGKVDLGGRTLVWPESAGPHDTVRSGMRIEGKGILLDDGSLEVKKAKLLSGGFDPDEAQFMSLVSQEVAQMKEKLVPYDDPALQDYVARVGAGLVPEWIDEKRIDFNFTVVDDAALNAFALPDGTVVVYTGLLRVLDNEAQLATVMGHEIAHATHRHGYLGYKHQGKMKWLQLGAIAGGILVGAKTDSPLAGLATGIGSSLTISAVVNGHGRDLEDEADRVGLEYMVDAGYNPFQAPEVWRVFSKNTSDQSSAANFFFSDHSTHRARISNLTREINSKYRGKIDLDQTTTQEDAYEKATARLKAQPPPKPKSP